MSADLVFAWRPSRLFLASLHLVLPLVAWGCSERASLLIELEEPESEAAWDFGSFALLMEEQCPLAFETQCGPEVECEAMDQDIPFNSPEEDLVTRAHLHSDESTDCGVGASGFENAITAESAVWVHNFGTCTNWGGFHAFDENIIGVGSDPEMFDIQRWQEKAAGHEGWSFANNCENMICHDHDFLQPLEVTCYGEH